MRVHFITIYLSIELCKVILTHSEIGEKGFNVITLSRKITNLIRLLYSKGQIVKIFKLEFVHP